MASTTLKNGQESVLSIDIQSARLEATANMVKSLSLDSDEDRTEEVVTSDEDRTEDYSDDNFLAEEDAEEDAEEENAEEDEDDLITFGANTCGNTDDEIDAILSDDDSDFE